MLIRYFAEIVAIQVLPPPIPLPTYPEQAYWHERFDDDPAHAWLRGLVKDAARSWGLPERPLKRAW
jgi:DNA-binding transcriptional LysR family regulator